MSENLRRYTKAIYAMDAVVQRTPPVVWDQQSPCEEWSAKQVLGHVLYAANSLTAAASGATPPDRLPEAELAGSDPKATWETSRDSLLAALDQQGALEKDFDGPFGRSSIDDFLGIHAVDCMLHTWDIATTAGIDAHLPPDMAAAACVGLASLGDAVRRPGLFGPAVETDSADPADRLVALAGRNP